jgi:L-lactate utilization protein LutB
MNPSNEIKRTLKALKANNSDTMLVETKEEACQAVLNIIPSDAVVGFGDSATLKQIAISDELVKRGNPVINPFTEEFRRNKKVSWAKATRDALLSDVFMSSSNAVTIDGTIVNIDNGGNRVAGMIYGPKEVIIVVGRNKIVKDEDEALFRLKNIITPYHAKRKGFRTPCAITGICNECDAPGRLCNVTAIFRKRRIKTTVIMVNQDLGLSWDNSWPQERIEKIKTEYKKVTFAGIESQE